VYTQLWHTTTGRMDGPISNHMWQSTRVSHAARRMTLQARFGTLYNALIALRMNRPYMLCNTTAGKCSLCGGEDSIGHMLGGCSHPTMHAIYIARHDEAVRIIAKAMRKGNFGGDYMLVDAGTESSLAPLWGCMTNAYPPGCYRRERPAGLTFSFTVAHTPEVPLGCTGPNAHTQTLQRQPAAEF
jgi:hypothetical protein